MNRHSDVLVIGGGVIGLACAYYLVRRGCRVRIVEKNRIGSGASHGNCGIIAPSHGLPLCQPGAVRQALRSMRCRNGAFSISPPAALSVFSWFLKFARNSRPQHLAHAIRAKAALLLSSRTLYDRLIETEGLSCDWLAGGVWVLFNDPRSMDAYSRASMALKALNLSASAHWGADLLEREPALRKGVCGGWLYADDATVRPDRLLAAWQRVIAAAGVRIEEDCPLKRFDLKGGRIRMLQTERGGFEADHYVLAAGAWSRPLAGQLELRLPIQAAKGYSLTMDRPSACPRIACIFADEMVVATPWSRGYRLGGLMEFDGMRPSIDPRRIQALERSAGRYLRTPLGPNPERPWTGFRPLACDDIPLIGRPRGHPNLVVAAGHGMLGISMAPATGKLVAEMIAGVEPHLDQAPYRPDRFRGGFLK